MRKGTPRALSAPRVASTHFIVGIPENSVKALQYSFPDGLM